MRHTELRKFLLEANQKRLSPVEKDVFLYYASRAPKGKRWYCPDSEVALEIGRSRNSVCEGRNALKKRGWVSENEAFQIEVLKDFSVGNATEIVENTTDSGRKRDSIVEDATEPVEDATEPVGNSTDYKDKNKNKNKEGKLEGNTSRPFQGEAAKLFLFWKETMGKNGNCIFTELRQKRVIARLRQGYTSEQIKIAILGCKVSPHNQGQNERGDVFDDIELICRSGEKVERFIGIYERKHESKGNATRTSKKDADTSDESAEETLKRIGANADI